MSDQVNIHMNPTVFFQMDFDTDFEYQMYPVQTDPILPDDPLPNEEYPEETKN